MDKSTEDILERVRRRREECDQLLGKDKIAPGSPAIKGSNNTVENDENAGPCMGEAGKGPTGGESNNTKDSQKHSMALRSAMRSPMKLVVATAKSTTFSAEVEYLCDMGEKSSTNTASRTLEKVDEEIVDTISTSNSRAPPLADKEEGSSTVRRSRFADLSAREEEFECDLRRDKEKTQSKDQLLKGPQKRISMPGETRPSVLFAPRDLAYKYVSPEKRTTPSKGASFTGVGQSPAKSPAATAGSPMAKIHERSPSLLLSGSSPKPYRTPPPVASDAVKAISNSKASTTPQKGEMICGKREGKGHDLDVQSSKQGLIGIKEVGVKTEHCSDTKAKRIQSALDEVSEEAEELDSSVEYGIHTFGQAVVGGQNKKEEQREGRQSKKIDEAESTDKEHSSVFEKIAESEKLRNTAVVQPQHTPTRATPTKVESSRSLAASAAMIGGSPRTPTAVPGSVKSLRNRWEFSSATGTPLHPDSSNDELMNAALSMAAGVTIGQRQPLKRNFRITNSGATQALNNYKTIEGEGSSGNKEWEQHAAVSPQRLVKSPAPKSARIEECGEAKKEVMEEGDLGDEEMSEHQITNLDGDRCESPTIADWQNSRVADFKTPVRRVGCDESPRPVTPNDEVLGSLMEEIEKELTKKGISSQQAGLKGSPIRTPGMPRKRKSPSQEDEWTDSADPSTPHTISHYRQLESAKRTARPGPAPMSPGSMGKPRVPHHHQVSTSSSPLKSGQSGLYPGIDSVDSLATMPQAAPSNDATLKRLHEAIVVQQDQICQASRALAFCRQNELFRGSREEVDAQRALLVATERRRAYWNEREQIMASGASKAGHYSQRSGSGDEPPRGILTFSYIAVRLSREFITSYCQQGPAESQLYYFIVLIKNGETVLHTSMTSSDEGLKNGFVEFSHHIQLGGLLPDFQCTVEVYALRAIRAEQEAHGKKGAKGGTWRKIISTPLGSGSSTLSSLFGPSGGPVGVMDPGFQRVGLLRLSRASISRNKFLLTDTLYPLDGQCMLQMRCYAEQPHSTAGDLRGFLSLYQLVSGLGAWKRFWCLLHGGKMCFWPYPEDEEQGREPTLKLPLSNCLTQVGEVSSSVASFPHSMQVDMAIGEKDAPKEEIRLQLAADTHEEKEKWTRLINAAIRNVNLWNIPAANQAYN